MSELLDHVAQLSLALRLVKSPAEIREILFQCWAIEELLLCVPLIAGKDSRYTPVKPRGVSEVVDRYLVLRRARLDVVSAQIPGQDAFVDRVLLRGILDENGRCAYRPVVELGDLVGNAVVPAKNAG